jgi:hypothetical protein
MIVPAQCAFDPCPATLLSFRLGGLPLTPTLSPQAGREGIDTPSASGASNNSTASGGATTGIDRGPERCVMPGSAASYAAGIHSVRLFT